MNDLEVRLGETLVGRLVNLDGDRNLFTFDPAYLEHPQRPVLSQSFYDAHRELHDLTRPTRRRLPPFFANLLPEGHLRQYVAQRGSVSPEREFPLIWLLGSDLPGAIVVADPHGAPLPPAEPAGERRDDRRPLRFSLAGVQLKLSAVLGRDNGLRIPAEGLGGEWIVKLPSATYARVPENEYAMMTFAREIGIDVPQIGLMPTAKIEGLPEDMRHDLGDAFVIRRFDRTAGGGRVHIEDFAQIQGLYPEEKYERTSYTIVADIVNQLAGTDALAEYVRRLVFTAGIGNGDMHAKNWSLIYPDGRTPRLAPAYDFVATLRYIADDVLALNLAGTKRWDQLDAARFERLADKARLSRRFVLGIVRDTVARMREVWPRIAGDLPLDPQTRAVVAGQFAAVPVFTPA
jgi:serine/threonine-protein kinase HipA